MGAREKIALVFLPLALAAIVFLPAWVYLTLVWAITMLSARELLVLLRRLGQPAPLVPTLVTLGLTLPALWFMGLHKAGAVLALVLLVMPAVYLLGHYPIGGGAAAITGATFTALYFLVTGGAMGLMRTAFAERPRHQGRAHPLPRDLGRRLRRVLPRQRVRQAPARPPREPEEVVGGSCRRHRPHRVRGVVLPHRVLPRAGGGHGGRAFRRPVPPAPRSATWWSRVFKRDAGVKDSSDLHPRSRRVPRPHRLALLRRPVRAGAHDPARGLRLKRLAVLGSTGSIGTATLDAAARFPEKFSVVALAAGRNLAVLESAGPRLSAAPGRRRGRGRRRQPAPDVPRGRGAGRGRRARSRGDPPRRHDRGRRVRGRARPGADLSRARPRPRGGARQQGDAGGGRRADDRRRARERRRHPPDRLRAQRAAPGAAGRPGREACAA